jgi:Domain of unknown function (DUF222)
MRSLAVAAPGAPVESPLDILAAATDQVAAEEGIQLLPSSRQQEDLLQLRKAIDRLEAEFCRRLASFDRTQAYAPTGALSTAAWLRWECRLDPGAASERVRLARSLDLLPGTRDAFAAGEIAFPHVQLLTRTLEEVGTEIAQGRGPREACFVGWRCRAHLAGGRPPGRPPPAAPGHPPPQILCRSRRWPGRPGKARESRYLVMSQTWEGMFFLNGLLDPESGATLRTALDACMAPPGPGDRRVTQRRADALQYGAGVGWITASKGLEGPSLPSFQ